MNGKRKYIDVLQNNRILVSLWIIDVVWTILGHLTLVVFSGGNILFEDLVMAVGYSIFRVCLFVYSILFIIVGLFDKEMVLSDKIKKALLVIGCYVGDALVLSVVALILGV